MSKIKNRFPALNAILKTNKISLEKEEFKTVLDLINGKDVPNPTLSPVAELVVSIFDQPELQENEFYMVSQKGDCLTEVNDQFAIAKTRSQLLKIMLQPEMIFPEVEVKTFGKVY